MTQKAKVVLVDGRYAVVRVSRKTLCEGCHNTDSSCSACFAFGDKNAECTAVNTAGAKVGDVVTVTAKFSHIIGYAALVFVLPIIIALALYFISEAFGSAHSIVWALGGFVISFAVFCLMLDKRIKKSPDTEIIAVENGENNNF